MADLTDETIGAYVDGALDPASAAKVEAAAASDSAVASRLAAQRRAKAEAKAALAPLLHEPVPGALRERVSQMARGARPSREPAVLPPVAKRARPVAGWAGMALAASVALVAGLGGGLLVDDLWTASEPGVVTAQLDQADLPASLRTVPSGEERVLEGGDRFRAIASFRLEDGTLCREFEVGYPDASSLVAVACREDGRWAMTFTVASASSEDGYAPVGALDALQSYLTSVGAGPPLEIAAERTALGALD
jgi:anti-sigma factor RsiW